jgi:non-heme chloroperoxidase
LGRKTEVRRRTEDGLLEKDSSYGTRANKKLKNGKPGKLKPEPESQRFRWLLILMLCTAGPLAAEKAWGQSNNQVPVQSVRGAGVTLHYVSTGRGEPVVMVHGGLEDYRAWTAQLAPLAAIHYRAIAYSRRYNFPNRNAPRDAASYSAEVDAHDLAMLIEKLHLGRVHLVGHSYGGLTALFFATEHPELVRTLTLSEPPLPAWVRQQPGGAPIARDFWERFWIPLRHALARSDSSQALAIAAKYFTGDPALPPAARAALEPNLLEWIVLTRSTNPFPAPSSAALRRINFPVLLLTGDRSLPFLQRGFDQLAMLLPGSRRVTLRNATHDMWSETPDACGAALRKFLREKRQTN